MRNILNISHNNVHTIALVLGAMSVIGYIVSFLRDRAFAHHFGPSEMLDVYVASFRIPDLLFIVATAFISVYALLPMFEEKKQEGEKSLREFIDTSFYFLLIFLIFGGTLLFFLVPVLSGYFFSGLSAGAFDTFILFSRVFLIQAILFSISNFFTGILQFKRKFLLYALLPIIYNLGIMLGVLVLYPLYGANGLMFGVLIGVMLNVGIQLPIILRNNLLPRIAPTRRMVRECGRTVLLSLPRASALLFTSASQLVIFGAVISLSQGVLSIFYFANTMKMVPLTIVGLAYSVASFPVLVRLFTEGNMESVRETIERSLCRLLLFILPLIAFIFTLREPLISFFFETGLFTPENTAVTAAIVGVFVFSALTMSIVFFAARAFYACKKSFTPFFVIAGLSIAEICSVYTIVEFFKENREVVSTVQSATGLSVEHGALFVIIAVMVAFEALAALVIITLLFRMLRQNILPILRALAQHAAASCILIIAVLGMKEYLFATVRFNSFEGFLSLGVMGVCGAAVWYAVLRFMKNKESDLLREKILSLLEFVRKSGRAG